MTMVRRNAEPRWRTSHGEDLEQLREALPKNLILPSPGAGSQRREVPEACSPIHRCTLMLGMEKTTMAMQP